MLAYMSRVKTPTYQQLQDRESGIMKSGYKVILLLFSTLFLWACGGGGDSGIQDDGSNSSGSGGGTTPDTYTVSLTLTDANGSAISKVSQAIPGVLTATVNKNDVVLANKRVNFSLDGKGSLGADSALTDVDGNASIDLLPGSELGAGTVTASISIDGGTTVAESLDFSTSGDGSSNESNINVSLKLIDKDGNSVNTINSITPGLVVATVTGINKPVIVQFATDRGSFPIDAVVTNDGEATAQILAGTEPGAGEITARLSTGETSDLIFTVGATNLFMGSGDTFAEGVAEVSTSNLSAGGTASISVKIQDGNGRPYTEPVSVLFSSTCSAKTSPTAELSSPVESFNGVATSTYLAQGCVGNDTINVSANVGGKTLSATGAISVLPADVGSISFVSAEPNFITLKGTGGDESSTIKFQVFDRNGAPVSNRRVNFALNTTNGGLTLSPDNAVTNSEGIVQTVVNSGTVPTPVRVTASIHDSDPLIASQSNTLYVSTGLPDQDSFSLSATNFNPEGWEYNDVEVVITAQLADSFNNPVRDGTSVTFTTEGGGIEDNCRTVNGTCSVTWTSHNPKPTGATLSQLGRVPSLTDTLEQPFGGRVTITAYAIGEESFPDTNGNNKFDIEELNQFESGRDVSGNPYDLPEAFVDYNEDRLFNPQIARYNDDTNTSGAQSSGDTEKLIDFNNDNLFDDRDKLYNGSLCNLGSNNTPHAGCSPTTSIHVRSSLVLVMSGSEAFSTVPELEDSCLDVDGVDPCDGLNSNRVIDVFGKSTGGASFIVSDLHNQSLPSGTEIRFSPSVGSIESRNPIIISSKNDNHAERISVTVKGGDEPESGVLTIEAVTPKGETTLLHQIGITIH